MKETDPDLELLARIGNNEADAVREMVTRKLPRLLALAGRLLGDAEEARDVAQDSFLRIWKIAASWRSGPARFDTWLHQVTLNLCRDRLRKRKILALDDGSQALTIVDEAPPPEALLQAEAQRKEMDAALAALPDRQREAIVLQYYQDLSNIEAAALMQISVEALESLLARARRNLRNHLAATDDRVRSGREKR
ncbi:RNA polymerase sigma factor [Pseudomonas sp. NPDC090202]|uniref:RNA polymerase sigma factor n=1 Tax=unclassified Pseudomonas TaxID=196821 RepID=UPI0038274C03